MSTSEELSLINRLALIQTAAWDFSKEDVEELYAQSEREDDDGQAAVSFKLAFQRLHSDMTRMVLTTLYTLPDKVSLSGLCTTMEYPESRKALNEWVLPTLQQLGLITGFEPRAFGDTTPHELRITEKGIKIHEELYLNRCRRRCGVFIEQLCELRASKENPDA